MASFSTALKTSVAFFHSKAKTLTEGTQEPYEALYKSAHSLRSADVWASSIAYCVDDTAADAEVSSNSAVTKVTQTTLTAVPGSNNQAYYYDDGTFVKPWIAPTDIPHSSTAAPSYGFQMLLYQSDDTLITPTEGRWVIDYYAGIVQFESGYTPVDMGWGAIKGTIYHYSGAGVSGDSTSACNWTLSGSDIYYNDGNVGIGNASPGYPLDIYKSATYDAALNVNNAFAGSTTMAHLMSSALSTDEYTNIYYGKATTSDNCAVLRYTLAAAGVFSIFHYGMTATKGFNIIDGGNVGIGRIPTTLRLDVEDDTASSNISIARFMCSNLSQDSNNLNSIYLGQSMTTNNAAGIRYHRRSTLSLLSFFHWGDSGIELCLQKGGNVGISNDTPTERLDIQDGSGDGAIRVGEHEAGSPTAGTVEWDGSNFRGYNGATWDNLDESGGGGGGSWNVVLKTGTYTAVSMDMIIASTAGGIFTIDLPSGPSLGDMVAIVNHDDSFATNDLTIDRNGSNIHGAAENLTVDTNESFVLVYSDATEGWVMALA